MGQKAYAQFDAVVIGASAGALDALSNILPSLPEHYAAPVLVVVHLPPDKDSVLAELLQAKCKVVVREAEDKDHIEAGHVYIAPPDYHMLVEATRDIALSGDEPVLFSRPSIDVLFESASDIYGDRLLGVVLTGANEDGAAGLKTIIDAGGTGIVQTPETASSSMMPQAALKIAKGSQALTLPQIARYLETFGENIND
jgi:two-component system chemotaxis response regulator CheB